VIAYLPTCGELAAYLDREANLPDDEKGPVDRWVRGLELKRAGPWRLGPAPGAEHRGVPSLATADSAPKIRHELPPGRWQHPGVWPIGLRA